MQNYRFKNAVIFDDHELFSQSFETLLEKTNLFTSVRSFQDEAAFLKHLISNIQYQNYIFLDFFINNKYSLSLINDIRRINKENKIIMISSVTNSSLVELIENHKPEGFISKFSNLQNVIECINNINENKTYRSEEIEILLSQIKTKGKQIFSTREIELLQYFNDGNTIEKTAEKLNLSKHTIIAHRKNMMAKTKTNSIIELLAIAREKNII